MNAQQADISQKTYERLIVFFTLVAAIIRFWHLGDRSLWIDEATSVALARMQWHDFSHALWLREANMVGYYLVLRYWVHLTTSEFGLRSLSVIIAFLTVPFVGLLGIRLYSRRAGLLAAALFAVHVWHIHFSREIRGYPLLVLVAVLGWLQLTSIMATPAWPRWIYFTFLSIFSVYLSFFAVFNIAAQFISLAFLRPSKIGGWNRIVGTAVLIVIGCLPAIDFVMLRNVGQLIWIPRTNWSTVSDFFNSLTGRWSGSLSVLLVTVAILCWSAFAILTLRRYGRGPESFAAALPIIGVLVPLVGLLAVSVYQPSFVSRYILYVVVPFVLGIGWLLSKFPSRVFVPTAIALVCVFLLPLPAYYREPSMQDFRGAVQYIAQRAKPGDVLFVWEPMARTGVDYYGNHIHGFPKVLYPRNSDHLVGEDIEGHIDPSLAKVQIAEHDRVWVVFNFEMPAESLGVSPYFFQVQAERSHRLASKVQFKNMRVLEYVRP